MKKTQNTKPTVQSVKSTVQGVKVYPPDEQASLVGTEGVNGQKAVPVQTLLPQRGRHVFPVHLPSERSEALEGGDTAALSRALSELAEGGSSVTHTRA